MLTLKNDRSYFTIEVKNGDTSSPDFISFKKWVESHCSVKLSTSEGAFTMQDNPRQTHLRGSRLVALKYNLRASKIIDSD